MATNINSNYSVTTEYATARYPGSIGSIISRQYRFCQFEPTAAAALPCGVFVTLTASPIGGYLAKPVSGATDKIYGVSLYNEQRVYDYDAATQSFLYRKDDIVSLIEEGDVFMYSEVAVEAGDDVFVRHTANGGLTRIGALANAAGTGLVAVPGCKFLRKITAPGVTQVSLPDII